MNTKRYLFLIILLAGSIAFANPLARIYRNDDPMLEKLLDLSIEAGILPITSSGPVTGHDVMRHIEQLRVAVDSPATRSRVEQLERQLTQRYIDIPVEAVMSINPEVYINTDTSAREQDWIIRYNQRNPFISIEVDTILSDHIYGVFSYDMKRRLNPDEFQGFNYNFPYQDGFAETQMESSMPRTAFMGLSGTRSSIIFGRDTLGWGRGNTGNLTVGDHVPYHDFLHASASNRLLRYTFLAIPMNELDETGNAVYPNRDSTPWRSLFHGSLARIYIAHRLEADLTSKIRLSLTEGTMFYTDRTDLRMFNPLMFLHNYLNFGEVNNSMTLELDASLTPGWAMNIQFLLDQFQTKGELNAYDDLPPNAFAALVGFNHVRSVNKGRIKAYIEGVYTSPYVYLRAGDSTHNYGEGDPEKQYNLDLVHAVTMRLGRGGTAFLGYPNGPDAIIGATGFSFDSENGFGVSGEIQFSIKGERGLQTENDDPTKNVQKVILGKSELYRLSPTGIPTYTLVFSPAAYLYLPKTHIKVWARTDLVNRWHANQYSTDTQLLIGAEYSLRIF